MHGKCPPPDLSNGLFLSSFRPQCKSHLQRESFTDDIHIVDLLFSTSALAYYFHCTYNNPDFVCYLLPSSYPNVSSTTAGRANVCPLLHRIIRQCITEGPIHIRLDPLTIFMHRSAPGFSLPTSNTCFSFRGAVPTLLEPRWSCLHPNTENKSLVICTAVTKEQGGEYRHSSALSAPQDSSEMWSALSAVLTCCSKQGSFAFLVSFLLIFFIASWVSVL